MEFVLAMMVWKNKTAKIIKGFTLAEVLITLMIIGILASMTIPSLIQEHEKKVYVTSLKKAYLSLYQAFQEIGNEEGCSGDIACSGAMAEWATFIVAMKQHLNIVNSGNKYVASASYYLNGTPNSNTNYSMMPGSAPFYFETIDGLYVTTYIDEIKQNTNCSDTNWVPTYHHCCDLKIDINGSKAPNKWGRDEFAFQIVSQPPYLIPVGSNTNLWGTPQSAKNCTDITTDGGLGCAKRIMNENWEMNY